MTQKELNYVEDAIGHEGTIIKEIEDAIENLEDETLVTFMENELKTHNKMQKDLKKLLEVKANE